MQGFRCNLSLSIFGRFGHFCLNLLAALTSLVCVTASRADLYFSDNFNYTTGNLSGNNGGTGWASAWSGGTGSTGNLVTNPLPGTVGNSVQISSSNGVTSRTLSQTYSTASLTGSNAYYLSFLFNANSFRGPVGFPGQYAGISLSGTDTNLLAGMPGDTGKIGLDWTNVGQPVTPYQPADNTNYLVLVKLQQGIDPTYAKATVWATTDLMMTGSTLEAQSNSDSTDNNGLLTHYAITFNTVSFSGGYTPGSINLSGLAMASTANEAVAFTQTAVPEPGTLLLGSLAATLGGCGFWRKRRKGSSPNPGPAA